MITEYNRGLSHHFIYHIYCLFIYFAVWESFLFLEKKVKTELLKNEVEKLIFKLQ